MSGTLLLYGSLGLLGTAIALLGTAVLGAAGHSSRPRTVGARQTVTMIEQRYARPDPDGPPAGSAPILPGWLRALVMKLSPAGMTRSLQRRLDLAGNTRWNADRLLAAKGLGLVAAGFIGGVNGLTYFHSLPMIMLCLCGAGAAGFFVPDLLLYNTGIKRQARIRHLLPDGLEILTVAVEAGLGFDAALTEVARKTRGPLAAEFSRVLMEMQIGKSRAEALQSLAERTAIPELRAFVVAVVQASELGTSFTQVLRDQARELRLKRRQRAEEAAQQLSVKILFPLITCLFPALMVVVIAPGGMRIAQGLFGHG